MLSRRIWNNLITHRVSQPTRSIAPFVGRLQDINQIINNQFSTSSQPRRPKHKNRAKSSRRRQREEVGEFDEDFDDDFDGSDEGDVGRSNYQSNFQSRSNNQRDESFDQDEYDYDDVDQSISRTTNRSDGLDSHIARVRKWRTDTRDLHSFLRVVQDDTILPRQLSNRIDWVAVDNEYQSGWNDRYETTNKPLYYLANHAAMRYAVIHRVVNETLKLAPMLSINPSIKVLDASFRVGAGAWAINQSISRSNNQSDNPSKARIASYAAIEPTMDYYKIARQLTQHLPMEIDIFQNLPSYEKIINQASNLPTNQSEQSVTELSELSEPVAPPASPSTSLSKNPDIVLFAYGLLDLGPNESKILIERLWQLVPEHGVLILIEKGSKEGWEAIRDARHKLLKRHRTPVSKELAAEQSVNQTSHQSVNPSDNQNAVVPTNELGLPVLPIPALQSPVVQPSHMTVLAPCAHDMACPQGPKSRCVFGNRTLTSSLPGSTPAKQIKSEDAFGGLAIDDFAYVVLHKGAVQVPSKVKPAEHPVASSKQSTKPDTQPNTQSNAQIDTQSLYPFAVHRYHRLTRPALIRQGHTILDMCTTDGKLERRVVPKKLGLDGGYVQAKHSRWGDMWQFDRVVTKTQLRKQRREAGKANSKPVETVVDAKIVGGKASSTNKQSKQSNRQSSKSSNQSSDKSEKEILQERVAREIAKLKLGDSLDAFRAADTEFQERAAAARAAKRGLKKPVSQQEQNQTDAQATNHIEDATSHIEDEEHNDFEDFEEEVEFEELDRETAKRAKQQKGGKRR